MQPKNTKLDAATVMLTMNLAERTALVERVAELPRELAASLRQSFVRRDKIQVSASDLELLDERLSSPQGRSVPQGIRSLLKGIHERVIDELNLLNAKTSSVAIDNASHTLYLSSTRSHAVPTLRDAEQLLSKLRALPLRLRGFKLTTKDRRLLRQCGLPSETMARVNSLLPALNLADVLVILAKRYEMDRSAQATIVADLLDFRRRILEYLDQESRRTVEIHRQRSLKTQQEWRRKSTNPDGS